MLSSPAARRSSRPGRAVRPRHRLRRARSALRGLGDGLGDLLRRLLAGDELGHAVVDLLADGRRVGLVEVELEAGRRGQRSRDHLDVRVLDRVLRRPCGRQHRAGRRRLALVGGVEQELQEVHRGRRGVLADREAVAAAERVGRLALAAVDRREREEAELVAEALLARRGGAPAPTAPTGPSAPWPPCRCPRRRPARPACRTRRRGSPSGTAARSTSSLRRCAGRRRSRGCRSSCPSAACLERVQAGRPAWPGRPSRSGPATSPCRPARSA